MTSCACHHYRRTNLGPVERGHRCAADSAAIVQCGRGCGQWAEREREIQGHQPLQDAKPLTCNEISDQQRPEMAGFAGLVTGGTATAWREREIGAECLHLRGVAEAQFRAKIRVRPEEPASSTGRVKGGLTRPRTALPVIPDLVARGRSEMCNSVAGHHGPCNVGFMWGACPLPSPDRLLPARVRGRRL